MERKTAEEFEAYLKTCEDPALARAMIRSLYPEMLPKDYDTEVVTMNSMEDIERVIRLDPDYIPRRALRIGDQVLVRKAERLFGPPVSRW